MQQEIKATLKRYPKRNILNIAQILGVTALEVSQAQHEHLKKHIPRSSPLWGMGRYGKV